jgi:DNA topoisomerase IB
VWICPWPNGHIQAVGTDSAGRRQYRYHDQWREDRDREKFDRVLDFAEALPALRSKVQRDLGRDGLDRDRVLSAIVRLLDVGFFRVGGDEYALEHETFGVSTLHKEHVSIKEGTMVFKYPAKGAAERFIEIKDGPACQVVRELRRRRSGGSSLFVYQRGRKWWDVHAHDVNEYIKSAVGEPFSAKDFRTWSATVLAAAELAKESPAPKSRTARRRAVLDALAIVAQQLGNTTAVSRRSYVDPRVVELFEEGEVIGSELAGPTGVKRLVRSQRGGAYRKVEEAVLELLDHSATSATPGST